MLTIKKLEVPGRILWHILDFLDLAESAKVTYSGIRTVYSGTGRTEFPVFIVDFDKPETFDEMVDWWNDIKVLDPPVIPDDEVDYELVEHYSGGHTNHVGPYKGYKLASERAAARMANSHTLHTIYLVPRSSPEYSSRYATHFISRGSLACQKKVNRS